MAMSGDNKSNGWAVNFFRVLHARLDQLLAPKSLRSRLILVIVLVDCIAVTSIGFIIVIKARSATKIEVAASMRVAEMLVPETVRLMQNTPPALLLQGLGLQFEFVRHVTVALTDEHGRSVPSSRNPRIDETNEMQKDDPPRWFYTLIAPPIDIRNYPIIVRNRSIGVATISSEPKDEVTEAWRYAHDLIIAAVALNVLVLWALIYLFGKVLEPLSSVVSGLKDFENRNYSVRIEKSGLKEIDFIIDRFNQTAEALDKTNDANFALNRKLLTIQDDERRHIAYELHDEAGGYLFALRASASSLLTIIQGAKKEDIEERAKDVLSLVEDVQGINRRILERLRPTALGRFPLEECLVKLVQTAQLTHDPIVNFRIEKLRDTYGRLIDLTAYRCVQEGLLNAIRHSDASEIALTVIEKNESKPVLYISIRDNGHGLADSFQFGVGLSAMSERIEALKGSFTIRSFSDGCYLEAIIPLDVTEMQDGRGV